MVEDDKNVRRLTVTRLEKLNYKVIAAPDGPKAIEILNKRDDIDLVLSDVVMPGGMTGFDVAKQALALRPGIKILLTTGYEKGIEPNGGRGGIDHPIIRKPYALHELGRTLRELLD